MLNNEHWIWLPKNKYPEYQAVPYSVLYSGVPENFTVAEFKRTYRFSKNVKSVKLRFSGDTEFQLYLNGDIIATGPVNVGGDFTANDRARSNFYASNLELDLNTDEINFFARVKLGSTEILDYSFGHGGFMLSGCVTFEDGTKKLITTDSTWLARRNVFYDKSRSFNNSYDEDSFVNAEEINNIWHPTDSLIPVRSEKLIIPENNLIKVLPLEEKTVDLPLDMIYAGYIYVKVKTKGKINIKFNCYEHNDFGLEENFVFCKDGEYRGFKMHSAGGLLLRIQSESSFEAEIEPMLITACYPTPVEAKTVTSDLMLNKVFDVCAHTLKYCRQYIHLDSPRHTEPLACTGDYYIESLMTLFTFGDMRLAEFDVIRTADQLMHNHGKMFHTTYSLIWVIMMYDTYMATGNMEMLKYCKNALMLLLGLFDTYMGDNGLLEKPSDYMFIDWIYIDGINLHHPPKALGQSCLNMYYYGALKYAAKIYRLLNDNEMALDSENKAENLKVAINKYLYDSEKGLYFEGLNTPTEEYLISDHMPQNVEKRYYRKHANILASLFDVCDKDTAIRLLNEVMNNDELGVVQPYFMHFLFEAIYKHGLRDEYTLKLIEKWYAPIKECDKGLVEGFYKPTPEYSFDHSHAWGGTPAYSLPKALLGFEMIEENFKKIKLSPSLLGLKNAKVEMPTPYGMLVCNMEEGKEPQFIIPDGLSIIK